MADYDFEKIEKKWQNYWSKTNYFEPKDDLKLPKKYILSMFPYPSGNIHMGHVRNYCIGDVMARYYRRKGFNVLHPFGWDAFGLPAENAAIKHQIHPRDWTYENINNMNPTFKRLGLSFAWNFEVITADEIYTKWEQLIFLKMWKKHLVYRKSQLLNWCDSCKTVLANEQVANNKCWRCNGPVSQKETEQYYLKITNYAQELQDDLELLKNHWPEQVLTMQKNWIAYETGHLANFDIIDNNNKHIQKLSIFNKDINKLANVDFIVIHASHPIVQYLQKHNYLNNEALKQLNKIKAAATVKDFSKRLALKLPIKAVAKYADKSYEVYVSDFISLGNNNRAMLIDTRLLKSHAEFAQLNNINLNTTPAIINQKALVASKQMNLQDWGISRQRYWGAPIPMVHCPKCGIVPEKEENLPIVLPRKVVFTGMGNPLLTNKAWLKTTCPKCGSKATRETDTFDTFFESSWYFQRYTVPPKMRQNKLLDKKHVNYWSTIDEYIGGIEHAIMHLLYARFFTKVLADLKLVDYREPFSNLLTQGMVLKDGLKMSKSKGNIVNPKEMIAKYGADTVRLFILFAAPPAKELEWSSAGIEGCYKFINRLVERSKDIDKNSDYLHIDKINLSADEKLARRKLYNALIKQETILNDRKNEYAFNTVIASCMEALNSYEKVTNKTLITEMFYVLLNILEPYIPHLAWEYSSKYFEFKNLRDFHVDQAALENDVVSYGITINGKMRCQIEVLKDNNNQEYVLAYAKKAASKWLEGQTILKEIYVPNKIVNIVIK